MKKLLYGISIVLILSSCNQISNVQDHIVNYIKSSQLGLKLDPNNINSDQKINYYYRGDLLYIADNINRRIVGLNSNNQIIFELGNSTDNKVVDGPNWENEIYDLMTEIQEKNKTKAPSDTVLLTSPKKDHNEKRVIETVKAKYRFEKIGTIAVDERSNIYVEHIYSKGKKFAGTVNKIESPLDQTKQETTVEEIAERLPENNSIINLLLEQNSKNQKNVGEIEILKFSSRGEFLYRIGEEGRDNPNFKGNITILNFFFNKNNNTMWLRYLKDDQILIRLYTGYGKNILFFEESKIAAALQPHMSNDNNAKYKYKIEDIYPIPTKREVMVVVDTFNAEDLYKVSSKQIFFLNSDYVVVDTRKIKNTDSQIYAITNDGNMYFLSYKPKESTHIIEVYNPSGKLFLRKNIDFQFGYYKRLGIDITGQGDLMGLFLRKDDFLFVLWK